ncbi:MAG: hypothetical protein HRU72_14505 [Planctomycetia bacterium]|nr:MAG: hypothetical protein HRU72_14505 [Planctomycetia bacterium]HQU31518.1 hypothetical protein [Candidatus Brocadia sapporoensis]
MNFILTTGRHGKTPFFHAELARHCLRITPFEIGINTTKRIVGGASRRAVLQKHGQARLVRATRPPVRR